MTGLGARALAASAGSFRLGPLDFDLPAGAFGTLLGPSGAGKTTLLRALAGLSPSDGEIVLGGARCAGPPEARPIGWVPQGGGLFPHLTALGNVALVRRKEAPPAAELLARAGAAHLASRSAGALSGGERLRVALARALGRLPRVLLLDEPLAAIDGPGREPLLELLAGLTRSGATVLQVTHDAPQALATSDWIEILDAGRLLAAGPFATLLGGPLPAAARRLLGSENLLAGTFAPAGGGLSAFSSPRCRLSVPGELSGEGCVLFPASAVALAPPGEAVTSIRNRVRDRIRSVGGDGPTLDAVLDSGLVAVVTRAAAEALALAPGVEVVAEIKATALRPLLRRSRAV